MRDNRLDIIRGFAILLLTITHTSPGRQVLDEFGNYYIWLGLFFHVADLFVAFSGLVCGIVYKRIMQREGQRAGIGKGLGRAAQLFIFNACAFLIVWAVVQSFGAFGIEGPVHKVPDSFAQAAFGTILLYDPIPFFNILNFYILMLIALPFFVAAQLRWRWPILLSCSIYLAYSGWQLIDRQPPVDAAFFVSPIAWQFMFFGGTTIGMNCERVRASLPPLSRTIGPIMLYLLITHFMRDQRWIVHNFSGKYDLGALRIIDLIIFSYVMDRLVSPKVEVTARSMRVISALGSNSLFCFSFTLFLCYGVSLALAVLDGSRAVYLGAILFEVGVMMWLGHLLLTRPGFREATQMKWVERLVQRYFGTSRASK